jgi:hypothetical protein
MGHGKRGGLVHTGAATGTCSNVAAA